MESKGVARRAPLAMVGWTMNPADRLGQRHEPAILSNRFGHRVIEFGKDIEHDAQRFRDLPRRDRARCRIDRNGRLRPEFSDLVRDVLVLIKQFVIGMGQLPLTAELADLSRKDSTHTAAKGVRSPGLVEKRQRQGSGSVRNHDFEKRTLPPIHRPIIDSNHLGHDCHRLVEGKGIERCQFTAFSVSSRVMTKKPTDSVEPERLSQCLRRSVADYPRKRGVKECGGFSHGFTLPPLHGAFRDWGRGR
ncbi:unannotated protein [freshwater metagenome]|uniref:Unannotated protein n=1 Tax=freshwater metagenome TaxID=449393 RepID=A0A6J6J2C1_9ZZZZ